ncbi:MAG: hypothetical protein EBV83_00915 [Verrucomicrobia bacterium]|nr:hypothetical protein [Verrucomicrobiota bacterium]
MSDQTTVRPEPIVKIFMGLAVASLITIAVCMVMLVNRGSQVVTRRPVVPVENRMPMMRNEMPPMPPGMMPPAGQPGQGMPEGMRPPSGAPSGQAPEKPVKK